jgi:hypothetical protein
MALVNIPFKGPGNKVDGAKLSGHTIAEKPPLDQVLSYTEGDRTPLAKLTEALKIAGQTKAKRKDLKMGLRGFEA